MSIFFHLLVILVFLIIAALNGYGAFRLRHGDNVLSKREYLAYQLGLVVSACCLLFGAAWSAFTAW